MSTFILQQDLPTLKAGSEFFPFFDPLQFYKCGDILLSIEVVEKNEDWFKRRFQSSQDIEDEGIREKVEELYGFQLRSMQFFIEKELLAAFEAGRNKKNETFEEYRNTLNIKK